MATVSVKEKRGDYWLRVNFPLAQRHLNPNGGAEAQRKYLLRVGSKQAARDIEEVRGLVEALLNTGTPLDEALTKVDAKMNGETHREAAAAKSIVDHAKHDTGLSVAQYFQRWYALVAPNARAAQQNDYSRHIENYVLPLIGHKPINSLEADDIQKLVNDLGAQLCSRGKRKGKPLSPKTVRNIVGGSFHAMITAARRNRKILDHDPFVRIVMPKWRTPGADPWTEPERDALLAWFAKKTWKRCNQEPRAHPAFHAYVHMQFWNFCSPSEASGLQWGDIDLGADVPSAHIQRSRHMREYNETKETCRERHIELAPDTVGLLRQIQPLKVTPEMPVFTAMAGGPIEPDAFLNHWYAAIRALGFRQRGMYTMKDTCVTIAMQREVPIRWLTAQTGEAYASFE